MNPAAGPLTGCGVVITRPAAQMPALTQALQAQGAQPWAFPVIDIQPPADPTAVSALAPRLASFDLAFFVSPNAVSQALALLPRPLWPPSVRVATVGPGTARALTEAGFSQVILPAAQFDSEAVLALPEFQADALRGRRVLILRGAGGRELVADTARARGAEVEQISCYRRVRAASDPRPLLAAWTAGALHALSLTSSEGAEHFAAILGDASAQVFASLPVFVPHARIAERVRSLGATCVVPHAAGDPALVSALVAFFAAAHPFRAP